MRALLIDHDDSFTENLRNWLQPLFIDVQIVSHHKLPQLKNSLEQQFGLIVLSPGPKSPVDYQNTLELLKSTSSDQRILGICLGMQMMIYADGGEIKPYDPPKHGKTSQLKILNKHHQEFQNYTVGRYHSLQCFPTSLFQVIAESNDDQIPMWVNHQKKNWLGFQFHPESFLTLNPEALRNYLKGWLQQ